jgi:hypothetical protein
VKLPTKRPLARSVLGGKLIEHGIRCSLIEALFYQKSDDTILQLVELRLRPTFRHRRNDHEEGGAGDIVAVWPPCLPVGIAQSLLTLALFAIADILRFACHAVPHFNTSTAWQTGNSATTSHAAESKIPVYESEILNPESAMRNLRQVAGNVR